MKALQRRNRNDVIAIPSIWVAAVLSLLVHVAALFVLVPKLPLLAKDARALGSMSALAVDLAPAKSRVAEAVPAPPAPAPKAQPPSPRPTGQLSRPKAARRRPTPPTLSPPVIAQQNPGAATAEPPTREPPGALEPPPAAPEPPRIATPPAEAPRPAAAPAQDLAAYIEARRRERGEATSPNAPGAAKTAEELESERRDRIVASNLGLDRMPIFGRDATNAGGLFQITELRYDDAQFYFFGFDKDIGRKAKQLIEVRRGDASDIRIAVVRRMIAIIRESTTGDFTWISQRLGHRVTLSARPEDNAELEEFIMRDIFSDPRRP